MKGREHPITLALVILILALLLGGLGFAVHALWILTVIVAAIWLIGFVLGSGERGRWHGRVT